MAKNIIESSKIFNQKKFKLQNFLNNIYLIIIYLYSSNEKLTISYECEFSLLLAPATHRLAGNDISDGNGKCFGRAVAARA